MKIDLNSKKSFSPSDAFINMLGGENQGDIVQLPVDLLTPYPNQKTFHKYHDDKLIELSEDIRRNGILFPVIVRPYEQDGKTLYQILAGHNRTAAAKMAGLAQVPCIVKVVDDNTAKIIFVTTNLNQREKLLHSEKAFAYKLLMESENDECQVGTAEKLAQQGSESRRQIFRYMRLTYLIQPFLNQVDDDELPFLAGVNISYLNEKSQWLLHEYVSSNELKIKLINSESIKNLSENGEIDCNQLDKVFKKKNKEVEKKSVKLPLTDIRSYFGELDDEEIVEKVVEIIKNHFNHD